MLVLNVFKVVFLGILLCINCDGGFVDTLPKCSISDDLCLKSLYQDAINTIGKTGIPEINMPPLDPIHVNNISAIAFDTIVFSVIDGVVEGMSGCIFTNSHLDFEKQFGTLDIICNITASGKVHISGTSPALQSIIEMLSVTSHSKGKVRYEKVKMHIIVPFTPYKKEDGEIYLKIRFENNYTFEIERAFFAAKNIYIGNQDISPIIITFMNNNWRDVMNSFGKIYIDKSLKEYFDITKIFFESVPASKFLTDLPY